MSPPSRADLERLDRDALIALAEKAGVTRARILTRPELVDELLLRGAGDDSTRRKARGLFGVARDLIARVVERGLHLPDAAERIRTLDIPQPPRRSAPAALPTVTLAEIYAAQGHKERAVETLESVLLREPDHAAAQALLTQLRDGSFPVPQPRLPPEPEESHRPRRGVVRGRDLDRRGPARAVRHARRHAAAPELRRRRVRRHPRRPAVALRLLGGPRRPRWASSGAAHPEGRLALRLVVVAPPGTVRRPRARRARLDAPLGDTLRELPPGCVVRPP